MGHWARHKYFGTMSAMNLPPDAEIVVNRLGEPIGAECRTVLVIRTPRVEAEARWDTAVGGNLRETSLRLPAEF